MSTIPSNDSTTQLQKKHTPACLGMIIGIAAFGVVLLLAAVTGYILFPWSDRAPSATEAPGVTPQIFSTSTRSSQPGVVPVETTAESPAATPPLDSTAAPAAEEPAQPVITPGTSFLLTVNVAALNVRTGPGTMYPVIITYPKGTQLQAIGRDADAAWFVISVSPDQQGWVSTALVTYDFDRYLLPVFPAPPIEYITPTPYGGAVLVPPELAGSQPLAPIQPEKRLISLLVTLLLAGLITFQERQKLVRQVKLTIRHALVFAVHLLSS